MVGTRAERDGWDHNKDVDVPSMCHLILRMLSSLLDLQSTLDYTSKKTAYNSDDPQVFVIGTVERFPS